MAAGLGFKTFTTGEVLTAADVNGYLMQGILVFATEAARDSAITSPQEGQFAFTKDNNSLWYYTGSAWVASGAAGDIEGVTAGVGISGGGTSGTVTITNSMATAIDAKGDLIVGTGADTFARLAVGTNGYTLVADSSTATGLAYAAPAGAAGMTLVSRQTITNSSGTNIDSIFTSSYRTYLIVIEKMNSYSGSGQEDVYLQLRYGTTTQAGNYKYRQVTFGGTYNSTEQNGVSQITLCANVGQGSTASSHFVWFSGLGNSSERANFYGNSVDPHSGTPNYYNGLVNDEQTYTGLRLTLSTGNFDATVAIYGLAK